MDIAIGQVENKTEDGKNEAAAMVSRGAATRAARLTPEERADVARKAAQSRWQRNRS